MGEVFVVRLGLSGKYVRVYRFLVFANRLKVLALRIG